MMFWVVFIPAWGLGMLGALLLGRGFAGLPRQGRAPHCRRCNFDLTGLWEVGREDTRSADRCPECGSLLHTHGAVVMGRLQRRPRKMIVGSLCLLCSLALFIIPAAQSRINWASLKPTWMLIGQTKSNNYWNAQPAAKELLVRLNDDRISDEQLSLIFDACLDQQKANPTLGNSATWPHLLGAAYDAGVLSEPQRTRHIRQLFATFYRMQQQPRDTYVLDEPFPFDDVTAMYPNPALVSSWMAYGQVMGMAAYLQEATIDGELLELRPTFYGPDWESAEEGWVGPWPQFGVPQGSGFKRTMFPEPVNMIANLTPPVGSHQLKLAWRIDVFRMGPGDTQFEHPFREADTSWSTETTHDFQVVESVEDVLKVIHSDGPNAQPPPRYCGPEDGLFLQVTEATKLYRDGDWYYRIRAQLNRIGPSPDSAYAFLARAHLEIGGVRYEVAEHRDITDVFYDRESAEPLDRSTPDMTRTAFTLNIIDLPRVERADIVLTPAPDLALKYPRNYSAKAYWGEPVVIPNVPIDWSGVELPE